jgi:putative transcriptional regulator
LRRRGSTEAYRRLGVSRRTVNAVETGRYDPGLPLAFGLARVFDLPIERTFDPEE